MNQAMLLQMDEILDWFTFKLSTVICKFSSRIYILSTASLLMQFPYNLRLPCSKVIFTNLPIGNAITVYIRMSFGIQINSNKPINELAQLSNVEAAFIGEQNH